MRRMRTGLLFASAVTLALSTPLVAQVAPSLTGETGLFELTNAETLGSGRFSFGLSYSKWDRVASSSLIVAPGADDPLRYGTSKLGLTIGFGLTSNVDMGLSVGQRYYFSDTRAWSGVINGHGVAGAVDHDETDKVRLGVKWLVNPKGPDAVRVVLFGGLTFPTQAKNDPLALSTYRTDWDFGASLNYGIVTGQFSYLNNADIGTPNSGDTRIGFDLPNELRVGLGLAVPVIPNVLRGIAEINRIHYDGGETKPPDFSEATLGARFGLGNSGFTASGAVRANIDRWVKYGSSPSNIGGLVQLAYMPQPPSGPDRVKVPASAPEPEPAPSAPAARNPVSTSPAPAPAPLTEPAPAPKAETSTTDEILFDSAKSRLTNIAKAILDGVALRLKNNLSATCTIVSFTDPKEKGDHAALARARAEAAKDYLMKRHGIDGNRVKLDMKGDTEAGADATRNRRAVVTVTFP